MFSRSIRALHQHSRVPLARLSASSNGGSKTRFLSALLPSLVAAAFSTSQCETTSSNSEHTAHGDKPRVIIADMDSFRSKVNEFRKQGPKKLLVITDFDHTLTPYYYKGKPGLSSHGVLNSSTALSPEFYEKSRALFMKYYPMEVCPTLSQEEKVGYMVEWWTKTHDLIIKHKLMKHHLREMTQHPDIALRIGYKKFFKDLHRNDVPVLIFSAGLYDIIHEMLLALEGEEFFTPNLHLISNAMEFDKNGQVVGFKGELLHTFSKNAKAIQGTPFWKHCEEREHILLMGDNLGDAEMSKGLDYHHIIRVGFLNVKSDSRLEEFLNTFDVVVVGDGDMSTPQMILDLVLNQT